MNARAELYHTNMGAGLDVFRDGFNAASDGVEVVHHFAVMPNTTYKLRIINENAQVTPWLGWDRMQNRLVHAPREGERWHLKSSHKFFYVPKSATTIAFYFGKEGLGTLQAGWDGILSIHGGSRKVPFCGC